MSKIPWSSITAVCFQQNLRSQFRLAVHSVCSFCTEIKKRVWKIQLLKFGLYRVKCVENSLLIHMHMCALLSCTKFFLLLKFYLWTVEFNISCLSLLMYLRCSYSLGSPQVHDCCYCSGQWGWPSICAVPGSIHRQATNNINPATSCIRTLLLNCCATTLFPCYGLINTFSGAELNRCTIHNRKRKYDIQQNLKTKW